MNRLFVYLAYIDASGTSPSHNPLVLGALMVPGDAFGHVEAHANVAVEHAVGPSASDAFSEFKATDLYWGHGQFENVPEERRWEVLDVLAWGLGGV